jgi:predicted metal-dependent hydrolase
MNAHVSYQVEPVVRTKLDFHLDQAPRFWFGGDPFRTRMFDALSLTFPDGERYFIEYVRCLLCHLGCIQTRGRIVLGHRRI